MYYIFYLALSAYLERLTENIIINASSWFLENDLYTLSEKKCFMFTLSELPLFKTVYQLMGIHYFYIYINGSLLSNYQTLVHVRSTHSVCAYIFMS